MRIEGAAEDLAVVEGRPLVGDAAAHDARRRRVPFDRRAPQLPAGRHVDGDRGVGIGDEHDAVMHERLGLLAVIAAERHAPCRNQPLHRLLVDRFERAVAVLAVPHPVGQHIVGVAPVVPEVIRGLRPGRPAGEKNQRDDGDCFHEFPPCETRIRRPRPCFPGLFLRRQGLFSNRLKSSWNAPPRQSPTEANHTANEGRASPLKNAGIDQFVDA